MTSKWVKIVKINSHLDTLEQNILKELDDAEDNIKSKIDSLLKQFSEESKIVERIQSDTRSGKRCILLYICNSFLSEYQMYYVK
jgi:hypothetical protein